MVRRLFITATSFPLLAAAFACRGGSNSPAAPSPLPNPAPPAAPASLPSETCWGVRIKRTKTAGVSGSLLEIIKAAQLPHLVNASGLITEFDGAHPPTGIIFLIKRAGSASAEYFHASAERFVLSRGDEYAAYEWKGVHPNPAGQCD